MGAEPASTAMHVFAESLRFAGDGFVTMATNAAAVALVSGFHGLLGGRAVSCHPALEADLQTVLRLPFPGNGPLGAIRIENMYWHSKLDEISTWCQQHAGGQAPVGVLGLGRDTILVAFFFFFFFRWLCTHLATLTCAAFLFIIESNRQDDNMADRPSSPGPRISGALSPCHRRRCCCAARRTAGPPGRAT